MTNARPPESQGILSRMRHEVARDNPPSHIGYLTVPPGVKAGDRIKLAAWPAQNSPHGLFLKARALTPDELEKDAAAAVERAHRIARGIEHAATRHELDTLARRLRRAEGWLHMTEAEHDALNARIRDRGVHIDHHHQTRRRMGG